jgi:DNA helicase HerA-like ATPase
LVHGEPLGYVVDNSTPIRVRFVATNPPPPGDFVVIGGSNVVALVERVGTRSVSMAALSGVYEPNLVARLSKLSNDVFFECVAEVVGVFEGGRLVLPRRPPLPGEPVYRAPSSLLQEIFGGSEPYRIRLGVLAARPEVPVYIDVNKLVTRHLAILAVTGAGKSNTVAVIADRLVRIGGTVVIMDFHGEYVDSDIGGKVNVVEPVLNPQTMTLNELMVLLGIEPHYYHQERVLRKAYERVVQEQAGKPFLERLRQAVESLRGREDARAVVAVANKIEGLLEKYGDVLRDDVPDILSRLKPGYANVVDLGRVDEDAADVVVSHVLRRLLAERKRMVLLGRGFPSPVMVFVEEAHVLAPRDRSTLSKYWMARIAREGRKFGVGLAIVSQRPKIVDQDILSQMNSKIVLRIVEPSDQRYVREASELLSEELAEQLSSLNTGEAIVIGPIVPVPVIVKVDYYRGRKGGADPDVVGEWVKLRQELESARKLVDELSSLTSIG